MSRDEICGSTWGTGTYQRCREDGRFLVMCNSKGTLTSGGGKGIYWKAVGWRAERQNNGPKGSRVLTPGACACHLMRQRGSADVIRLWLRRPGECPALSGAQGDHQGPYKRDAGAVEPEGADDRAEVRARWVHEPRSAGAP